MLRRARQPVRVYRAETFNMSAEDRIQNDARHLLETGLAETIDQAVDMAVESLRNPKGGRKEINEMIVKAQVRQTRKPV